MSYYIEGGIWSSVFAVPCTVIDDHIHMCPPNSLKVLLLMLRHPGMPVDLIWLSEQLRETPAEVQDAVSYWVSAGIVTDSTAQEELVQDAAPTPAYTAPSLPENQPPVVPVPAVAPSVTEKNIGGQKIITTSVRPRISRDDVDLISQKDPSLYQLLREAQSILNGPLSPVDSEILAALHVYYGLPADVVLMLLEYCVSTGKTNMHTVEKMAASWVERDIMTHERAEEEILRLTQVGEDEKKIIQAFHLQGRSLSAKEREYVERWFALGMDERIISYACESTLDKTGKVSFAYADKMILSWKSKGIQSIREAVEEQKKGAVKFTPGTRTAQTAGSSIDKDALDAFIDGQFTE